MPCLRSFAGILTRACLPVNDEGRYSPGASSPSECQQFLNLPPVTAGVGNRLSWGNRSNSGPLKVGSAVASIGSRNSIRLNGGLPSRIATDRDMATTRLPPVLHVA